MHLGSTFGRKRQTFITEKREKKRTNQKKRINSDQKHTFGSGVENKTPGDHRHPAN